MSDEHKTQETQDKRSFEDRVFARFDALDARLGGFETRLDGLEARMAALEETVGRRMQETRPIWETALAEIAETRKEMHANFRKLERQLSALSVDVLETRGTVSDLESRVDKIDKSPV